jgi:hypothetical protein
VASSVIFSRRVPVDRGLGELVEEPVRFGVPDAVALLDGAVADRLGEMTFAGPGRAEEERVLVGRDEAAGGKREDEGAVDLAVEVKVEGVERLAGVPEAGLRAPASEEPILAADELIGDERGDEIERHQPLGLGLTEPGLEPVGHAGEPQLTERTVEFSEGHSRISFSARRSMRSR